ncbi:hypothetical protein CSC19_1128 [Enterobacter hormaechei]|nr:hypothetical protein CSC19_1128 [Enterobacter hormaechei]
MSLGKPMLSAALPCDRLTPKRKMNMQLGRKSKNGLRTFLRSDAIVIADKKGKPKVVMGVFNEDDNGLRSGKPSSFNKLGRA